MTIRQVKSGLKAKTLLWAPKQTVRARTEFQKKRIRRAIAECRLYLLKGFTTNQLALLRGRSRQAEEQVLKVGVQYLLAARWIRPAEGGQGCLPSG